jgi:PAS domain-containing protein
VHGTGTPQQGHDFGTLVHPDDWPVLQGLLDLLTPGEGREVSAVRLRNAGGGWHRLTGRITHLLSDPAVRALLLQLHPQAEVQREAFSRISRALSSSYTVPDVVDTLLSTGLDAIGAAAGAIHLLSSDERHLELTGAVGYASATVSPWARCSMNEDLPVVRAVRNQQPLFFRDDTTSPGFAVLSLDPGVAPHSAAVLPLVIGHRTIGSFVVSFARDKTFSLEDQAFLTTVADLCAPALDRGRLQRELRQEQDWYHTVTRNSSDIATVMGEDGTIHYESGSVTRILGFSPTELLGLNAFALIHPDDISPTHGVSLPAPRRALGLAGKYCRGPAPGGPCAWNSGEFTRRDDQQGGPGGQPAGHAGPGTQRTQLPASGAGQW